MWDHPETVDLRQTVAEIEAEWASARAGEVSDVRKRHRLALTEIRDRISELRTKADALPTGTSPLSSPP